MSKPAESNSLTQKSEKSEHAIITGKPPFENMVWIPGGCFDGFRQTLSGRSAGARSYHRWLLDGHTYRDEREFRRLLMRLSTSRLPNVLLIRHYPGAKPELLVPASVVFQKPRQRVDLRDCYQWWTYVPGANWRHPEGPASSLKGKAKHPVVQLAYEDAEAYAKWIGKELPTEAEWEFAARGGLAGAEFVWGDEFTPAGNIWRTVGRGASLAKS